MPQMPRNRRASPPQPNVRLVAPMAPCEEDAGWNPGPDANSAMQRLPAYAQSKSNEFSNACDPLYGLAIRYFPANFRAYLSEIDPAPPGPPPPIYFRPITQATAASITKGWVRIGEVRIPNGFNPIAAKIVAAVQPQEWANAVQFRLLSTGSQVAGLEWRGRIEWPSVRPLMRVGEPGRPVAVEALIEPAYWTTGTTPIRSRVTAEVMIEVLCHSVAAPCGPDEGEA